MPRTAVDRSPEESLVELTMALRESPFCMHTHFRLSRMFIIAIFHGIVTVASAVANQVCVNFRQHGKFRFEFPSQNNSCSVRSLCPRFIMFGFRDSYGWSSSEEPIAFLSNQNQVFVSCSTLRKFRVGHYWCALFAPPTVFSYCSQT